MKVEQIEIYPLEAKLSKPFGWSQRWTDARMQAVVKITADDGTYGWGESGDARTMEFFAPLLIGKNPRRTETMWQMLYELGYQGHGFAGSQTLAISAFDMALWDIAGKAVGLPVCELLGGSVRDRIPVYATGLYYTEGDFPDALTEEALGYAQAGFTGMKMKIGGKPVDEDIERVYHLREVLGPQTHLMVDANEAYSPTTAVMVAQKLADADLTWFEEPCGSYNDGGNLLVQQLGLMPIAGGESLKSRYEFAERLASRMFDIIQPDIAIAGGVSEMFKLGHMANAFGIHFNPHFWGTGISLSATLHVLACQPSNPPSDCPEPYINQSVMEFDRTPHPIRENLTDPIFDQVGSHIPVPTTPGLGIEVIEEEARRFLGWGLTAPIRITA